MPGYNEGDEGSGDSGVLAPNGPSKDAVKKLDQIIQVGLYPTTDSVYKASVANYWVAEFSYKSCDCGAAITNVITGGHYKRWNQESQ